MLTPAEEIALRRAADREGLLLIKSATRDRRNPTFQKYMLLTSDTHEARLGGIGKPYRATADMVRDYLDRLALDRLAAAEPVELTAA